MKNKPNVVVPKGHKARKKEYEAAWVLARHYKTVVYIIKPPNEYLVGSPNFCINNELFELKTHISAKTEKVERLIWEASQQADNIVIDGRSSLTLPNNQATIKEERPLGCLHQRKEYSISR
ncbi:hypothetical protein FWH13_02720 [Candidatus Saccharibacteria bacterium]|nr:hypothetical protein [Candidatus Saccharibacteria bacterium]